MILFIGLWHLVGVLGVCLAFAAFVGVSALLWFLWDIWQQIEDEKASVVTTKREKRSASAKQGWATRKANAEVDIVTQMRCSGEVYQEKDETEPSFTYQQVRELQERGYERINNPRRTTDEITPDDAFVQWGEDQ